MVAALAASHFQTAQPSNDAQNDSVEDVLKQSHNEVGKNHKTLHARFFQLPLPVAAVHFDLSIRLNVSLEIEDVVYHICNTVSKHKSNSHSFEVAVDNIEFRYLQSLYASIDPMEFFIVCAADSYHSWSDGMAHQVLLEKNNKTLACFESVLDIVLCATRSLTSCLTVLEALILLPVVAAEVVAVNASGQLVVIVDGREVIEDGVLLRLSSRNGNNSRHVRSNISHHLLSVRVIGATFVINSVVRLVDIVHAAILEHCGSLDHLVFLLIHFNCQIRFQKRNKI